MTIFYYSVGPPRHQPGRIAEYEPEEPHSGGTPYSSRNSAGARQVYDSSVGKGEAVFTVKILKIWTTEKLL